MLKIILSLWLLSLSLLPLAQEAESKIGHRAAAPAPARAATVHPGV
jgi:hypothetical protein